ncbi:hypothetical protein AB9K17_23590, partial [Salmonella enterica subsp. enterica serovar Kentucky]|uniref:hypothetical protein n=1 Tax=Salmonella enterica TaxID=28901 RepID=UPI003F4BBC8C
VIILVVYFCVIILILFSTGCLTNEQISLVCQSLAGRLNLNTIDNFAKRLKSSADCSQVAVYIARNHMSMPGT